MSRLASSFQQLDHYQTQQGYSLLPFRFLDLDSQRAVLTNLAGEHLVVPKTVVSALVNKGIDAAHPNAADLEAKHFLSRSDSDSHVELLAAQLRTRQSQLPDFTRLHIFVTTLRCDHSCAYCQVSRVSEDRAAFDMTGEVADGAVDLMLESPSPHVKVEFQGGEPLLNFPLLQRIVERVERKIGLREAAFVVTTNLAFIDDEMLDYFAAHRISVSTSLDGPEGLHNQNRPRPGKDAYSRTIAGIRRCRERLGGDAVSALMTCTLASLEQPEAIIDEYVAQGFRDIFLRHISPYGFAARSAGRVSYETERFVDFYRRGLDHILRRNREGVLIRETYTCLLLRRMLTSFPTGYVDLQSPAGAGLSAIVYNYNGEVYPSDEGRMLAEMGDKRFKLGDVGKNTWEELFLDSDILDISYRTMNEGLVGCSECAFQSWCGSDPVFHYATQGDEVGHRPTSAFCHRNMAVMKHLVRILEDRPGDAAILRGWLK